MCTLVAAGYGDALSHLLAGRGVLLVVLLHVTTLFGRVHLVPAEVGDLRECRRASASMASWNNTGRDDDSQRRRDACFFKQRSAWQRWVFDGPTTARRASRAVNL